MSESEIEEYRELQQYIELCSLGDHPQSPAADKLRRWWELYLKVLELERNNEKSI